MSVRLSRALLRLVAALVALAAVPAVGAAWAVLGVRADLRDVLSGSGSDGGGTVIAWADLRPVSVAYAVVVVLLLLATATALAAGRRRTALVAGLSVVVAAATLPITPFPLSGRWSYGGAGGSDDLGYRSIGVAAGLWVAVAVVALGLAVALWRTRPRSTGSSLLPAAGPPAHDVPATGS